jgi:hypothetical protein
MKKFLYSLHFLLFVVIAEAQITVTYDQHQVIVKDHQAFDRPIAFDEPVQPGDGEWVKLFKGYFNPGSLDVFRSYYLSHDWFHPTQQDFDHWQQRIKQKRLSLHSIFHVTDDEGVEYLVFQYALTDPAFEILQSSEFKKTGSGWKHTSQQNDEIANILSRLGSITHDYYQQQASRGSALQLDQLAANQVRTYRERFDRTAVFEKIKTMLITKGVSESDIAHAKKLFLLKDDTGWLEFIGNQYQLDDADLITATNGATGMELYRISHQPQN